ncbi:MAG: fructose-2 6-bisphosphatase [Rhodocyclaceae bacterium]|nr:MAG: fructose-2 6-bisphosphatase [Rhodocyclaceae bacterium]TND03883.1 MAG: fructose-2,6-bisphosphatase [Rhodocyclaceae bacterium]
MQLWLIRHPPPQVAASVCYGRTDLALADDVAAAAARIRPQLPPHGPLFTSPLQRCRQLAAALHPAPQSDERLQEMHFGDWEMTPWAQIQREALDGWAADPLGYRPPQGESVTELQARVYAFVAEVRGAGLERAVLVTHAGVMKVIVGLAQGMLPQKWMALMFEYERVIRVDIECP